MSHRSFYSLIYPDCLFPVCGFWLESLSKNQSFLFSLARNHLKQYCVCIFMYVCMCMFTEVRNNYPGNLQTAKFFDAVGTLCKSVSQLISCSRAHKSTCERGQTNEGDRDRGQVGKIPNRVFPYSIRQGEMTNVLVSTQACERVIFPNRYLVNP